MYPALLEVAISWPEWNALRPRPFRERESLRTELERRGQNETTAAVGQSDLEQVIARWAQYPYSV